MSLEFALQYGCPLRDRRGERTLRAWGRYSSLLGKISGGTFSAEEQDKFASLLPSSEEIRLIKSETMICSRCPACLDEEREETGELVGCLGRINYPITAEFEKFMANRVQLVLDTIEEVDQPRLLRILVDPETPFDGEVSKELRRVTTPEGLRFFELRVPIKLSRRGANLTTDNVFDMLAGFSSEGQHETSYAREFPVSAAPDFYDFLDLILRNDLSKSEIERLNRENNNYAQFLRLLTAFEVSESLNARLLVD